MVVVDDVEPLGFLVLVRLYQLVRQALVSRIFTHLNTSPSYYSRVVGTRLWLHPEELPEQNPVGLDSHKCLTELYKDRDVKDTIGIKIQVLDVVVPEKTFEEITGGECESTLHESGEHWNLIWILLRGIRVASGGAPQIHLLFSQKPAVDQASRSSVFNLAFFHSLAGLGCGEDGGDDSGADSSASLQALFFHAPIFELLDRDAFILQVQGVFTRIRSGATLVMDGGSAPGSFLSRDGSGSRGSAGED
jgi:hypothetical protein